MSKYDLIKSAVSNSQELKKQVSKKTGSAGKQATK